MRLSARRRRATLSLSPARSTIGKGQVPPENLFDMAKLAKITAAVSIQRDSEPLHRAGGEDETECNELNQLLREKLSITQQSSVAPIPVSGVMVSTATPAPKAMATVTAVKMIARAVCGDAATNVTAAPVARATATAAKMIARFMLKPPVYVCLL
jgi:hypothetical protein